MERGPSKDIEHYKSLKQGSEEWLQARKDFDLTASELGPALGLGRFHTRLQLYRAKKKVSSPKKEGKGTQTAFEYGRLHEADAAQEFQQSCCASSGFVLTETGIWPLYYDSFSLGVSPDRLVIDPENEGAVVATYEAKCPVSGKLMNPPHPEYLLQVHAQIQAVSVDEGYLHADAGEEFVLSRAGMMSCGMSWLGQPRDLLSNTFARTCLHLRPMMTTTSMWAIS